MYKIDNLDTMPMKKELLPDSPPLKVNLFNEGSKVGSILQHTAIKVIAMEQEKSEL